MPGAEDAEQRGTIELMDILVTQPTNQPTCLLVTFAGDEETSRKSILTHNLAFWHLGLQLSDNFLWIFTPWKAVARRFYKI